MVVAVVFGLVVLSMRAFGSIDVPGYAATIGTILFFGALNALGLGIIGTYVWRAFANTQRRPIAIEMYREHFSGHPLIEPSEP